MFRASQFLSEELPIRLAHRVQELTELPEGLSEMPSIQRVTDWYAQSFEVKHSYSQAKFYTNLRAWLGNHETSTTIITIQHQGASHKACAGLTKTPLAKHTKPKSARSRTGEWQRQQRASCFSKKILCCLGRRWRLASGASRL